MKNIKRLLLVLLVAVMVIPFAVRAEGETNKVTIYMFRGEGCPHCEEALEWFDSLDKKTADKINLVQYETWYDTDNASLMKKVAKAMGDDTSSLGVPYIVVGDKSFIGFADSYKDQLLNKVNELYGKEDVYDVMEHLDETKKETKENDSKAVTVIIAFVVLAAAVLIYYVSKSK